MTASYCIHETTKTWVGLNFITLQTPEFQVWWDWPTLL